MKSCLQTHDFIIISDRSLTACYICRQSVNECCLNKNILTAAFLSVKMCVVCALRTRLEIFQSMYYCEFMYGIQKLLLIQSVIFKCCIFSSRFYYSSQSIYKTATSFHIYRYVIISDIHDFYPPPPLSRRFQMKGKGQGQG